MLDKFFGHYHVGAYRIPNMVMRKITIINNKKKKLAVVLYLFG
jgi:hypothetical protein